MEGKEITEVSDFTGELIGTVPQSCMSVDACRLLDLPQHTKFFDAKGQPLARNASPLPAVVQVLFEKEGPISVKRFSCVEDADVKELKQAGVFAFVNKMLLNKHKNPLMSESININRASVRALLKEKFGSFDKEGLMIRAFRRNGFLVFNKPLVYQFIL